MWKWKNWAGYKNYYKKNDGIFIIFDVTEFGYRTKTFESTEVLFNLIKEKSTTSSSDTKDPKVPDDKIIYLIGNQVNICNKRKNSQPAS